MYKLFYSPGACSMAVHVALNETGAKYQLVKAELHGAQKDQELLKVNARHQVPVLVDGDQVIREGAAILIHLLEKENSPLLPKADPTRARALEWLCWANSSLHPKYGLGFSVKGVSDDPKIQDAVGAFACKNIQKLWDDAETHLAKNKYLAGDQITMGDILMTVIANWSPKMPKPINLGANVKRVIREVIARPSYQEALSSEQVEYKAAA
jgi:glutathione S-transferase